MNEIQSLYTIDRFASLELIDNWTDLIQSFGPLVLKLWMLHLELEYGNVGVSSCLFDPEGN